MTSEDDRALPKNLPSLELIKAHRDWLQRGAEWSEAMTVFCSRGSQEEFDLAKVFAGSRDALDRRAAADLLGQLGGERQTFREDSIEILLGLSTGDSDEVTSSALFALGHRGSKRGARRGLELVRHPCADVRLGVVNVLSGHTDPDSIAAMIQLAADGDRDVRNWAAFGLGTMCDIDTPELRDALARLLGDDDAEVRGEAMIGLAKRQDPRALAAVERELAGDYLGDWCLEAAESLALPSLLPALYQLKERVHAKSPGEHELSFESAIMACEQAVDPDGSADQK